MTSRLWYEEAPKRQMSGRNRHPWAKSLELELFEDVRQYFCSTNWSNFGPLPDYLKMASIGVAWSLTADLHQ